MKCGKVLIKGERRHPSKVGIPSKIRPTIEFPAQGFIKEESPGSRAHLCHIVKPKKRESLALKASLLHLHFLPYLILSLL
jgi:hypothetical protein